MTPSKTCYFHNFYCQRRKRRRTSLQTIKSFLMCVSLSSLLVITLLLYKDSMGQRGEAIIDLSNNYLQIVDKFSNPSIPGRGFLVDTPKCRIPDVDIWDVGIRPFVKPPSKFKCAETYLSLTHVVGDTIVINDTALKLVGYTMDQITCCYQIVERINLARESYNMTADNLYRYSHECYQMERTTKPKASFIKVACKVKGFFEGFFTYSNFHMLAMLPPDQNSDSESSRNIAKKLAWWKDCLSKNGNAMGSRTELCQQFRDYGRPPNVLMIGWDSSSRNNFHRFMHRTVDILESIIKPVEMVGYNKVGENTFPNFVPLMSSLSVTELEKECFSNSSAFQDDCPYLWKKFDEHNYLTAHLEDAPKIAIFNYFKTGFLKPPVDIYSRSFMLAAYEEKGGGEDLIDCIGYQRPEEIILNYIVDLATLAETEQIPYFLTTWLTDLTHYDMNNLQLADAMMAKSLLHLYEKGLLENTVLYLMSDHGYRFLEIRSTTSGWFEDKLPALWIKLPPAVIKVHPSWMDSLQDNSRQLVTPFDLHQSFRQILAAYSRPVENENLTKSLLPSIRGQSIFSKLPTRSCEEAEIPIEYCACIPPTACIFNSVLIKLAAEKVVESINANLPSECTPLRVATVTACGMLKERTTSALNNEVIQANTNATSESYFTDQVVVVTLLTSPGNFLFEAMVHFNKSTQHFGKVFKLIRMNKKTTSSACLVETNSWIELLCFCDTVSIWKTFLLKTFSL